MRRRVIKSLYEAHAWTGLIAGLILIVICASGSVAVFKSDIDRLANPALLEVEPGGERLPWGRIVAASLRADPAADVQWVALPREATEPYLFWIKREGGSYREIAIDPYTAHLLGDRDRQNTLADYVRQFHVRLLMGFWGRVFVGAFGLVLLAATATGLVIYSPMNKRSWVPRLRRGLGARVLLADLHKVVGLGALLFNLMFAATGAVLGLENLAYYVRDREDAGQAASGTAGPRFPAAGVVEAGVVEARRIFPGLEPSWLQFDLPDQFRIYVSHPIAHLVKEKVSFAAFDPATSVMVEAYDGTSADFWTRAYYSCEPLHFGQFGGMPVKLLYALMGLTAGFLSISGYAIYAIRRRGRRRVSAVGVRPANATPHAASPGGIGAVGR